MDASNPVMSSDRRSISEVRDILQVRKRQNLRYLETVASSATRTVLPVDIPLEEESHVKGWVHDLEAKVPQELLEVQKGQDVFERELEGIFDLLAESIPICGLLDHRKIPLHPPSVNNIKGRVSVRRTWGGAQLRPLGVHQILQVVGEEGPKNVNKIYTSGLREGFLVRLKKQMTRKCVSVRNSLGTFLGKPVSMGYALNKLEELMPWEGNFEALSWDEDLNVLLSDIEITMSASAGAPYWANKGESLDNIFDVVLPLIVEAIKVPGGLTKLYREQPELFLVEVKNKLDRYPLDKIKTKVRPYVNTPAHFAFLFSYLCQEFLKGLLLFTTKGSNAYGFSPAFGGMEEMVNWMDEMFLEKNRSVKGIYYGDDSRIIFKIENKVFMINPDMEQMDGSVDYDSIQLTIQYVLKCLEKKFGESPFWRCVANQWLIFATAPPFVIEGSKVWKKKNKDGLMTGVPGTTLFDTVKAALSWEVCFEAFRTGLLDLRDEKAVVSFMKTNCGLTIKEGTFNVEQMDRKESVAPGDLYCSSKFLGVQIYKKPSLVDPQGFVYCPTIPREEMIEMMLVQKDNPHEKGMSLLSRQRLLFDRMRGYMITFGFTDVLIKDAIAHVVNSLPSSVIIMDTSLKAGEKPESILLSDFCFPDSDGFPSVDFCDAVYSSNVENREDYWISLFPGLRDVLRGFKLESRVMRRAIMPTLEYAHVVEKEFCTQLEPPEELIEMVPLALEENKDKWEEKDFNIRSKIFDPHGTLYKTLPDLAQSMKSFIDELGGVSTVAVVKRKFQVTPTQILEALNKIGYFCSSFYDDGLISASPIQVPGESPQDYIKDEVLKSGDKIDKHTTVRAINVKSVGLSKSDVPEKMILTRPTDLQIPHAFVESLSEVSVISNSDSLVVRVTTFLNRQPVHYTVRWRSEVVNKKATGIKDSLVQATLYVKAAGNSDYKYVGYARAPTYRLAQGYMCRELAERFNEVLAQRGRPPLDFGIPYSFVNPLPEVDVAKVVERKKVEGIYAPMAQMYQVLPGPVFNDAVNPDRLRDGVPNSKEILSMVGAMKAIDSALEILHMRIKDLSADDLLVMYGQAGVIWQQSKGSGLVDDLALAYVYVSLHPDKQALYDQYHDEVFGMGKSPRKVDFIPPPSWSMEDLVLDDPINSAWKGQLMQPPPVASGGGEMTLKKKKKKKKFSELSPEAKKSHNKRNRENRKRRYKELLNSYSRGVDVVK